MDPCSLVLETLFVFTNGRIATTREPSARRAPAFVLVRDATSCAWAVGAHVARQLAETLDALAGEEQPRRIRSSHRGTRRAIASSSAMR